MKTERYERAEIELIRFSTEDVLVNTPENSGEDNLPFVPKKN